MDCLSRPIMLPLLPCEVVFLFACASLNLYFFVSKVTGEQLSYRRGSFRIDRFTYHAIAYNWSKSMSLGQII